MTSVLFIPGLLLCQQPCLKHNKRVTLQNERKTEQAHKPHAPPLLDNATHNKWHDMH